MDNADHDDRLWIEFIRHCIELMKIIRRREQLEQLPEWPIG